MLLNCFKISNIQHSFHPNLTIILMLLNNFTIVLKEICDDLLHFETFWLSGRIHCYNTVFPLEDSLSGPRPPDFGPISWQITQSRPVPNLNVDEYARFHGRAAETNLNQNIGCFHGQALIPDLSRCPFCREDIIAPHIPRSRHWFSPREAALPSRQDSMNEP